MQVPNDCLLPQEVIAKLLTEPKRQHVVSECPENTMQISTNGNFVINHLQQQKPNQ